MMTRLESFKLIVLAFAICAALVMPQPTVGYALGINPGNCELASNAQVTTGKQVS